jgi:hypothetical protein
MTRRITSLIEEQENRSKLLRTRNLDVEVERIQADSQMSRTPTLDREDVLLYDPMKGSQQREVTMPKGDKTPNGKRNTKTKITGKKDRNLSKKRSKIERLQKVLEGTSQKEGLQDWNFARISEQHNMALHHGEVTYLLESL